jgi:5-methylcytosine-specific restriction endonuclease McrA
MRCLVCQNPNTDKAHIKTKGSGGDDDDSNIMPLCRRCHSEQHTIGIGTFVSKYPQVRRFLFVRGWELVDDNGVKRIRRI